MQRIPEVCIIAGSDSIGGAGLQADLRIVTLLGCNASNVVTCVTAQDLKGVHAIRHLEGEIISNQLICALSSKPKAVKIGMLGNTEIMLEIYSALKNTTIPIVLDPVLVSTSNSRLTQERATSTLIEKIIPISYLITPNLFEAQVLSGKRIFDAESAKIAALQILNLGIGNVLIKGIREKDGEMLDLLVSQEGVITEFRKKEIQISTTHGTGCRLSSSIACYLAMGETLKEAISLSLELMKSEILHMKVLYDTNI